MAEHRMKLQPRPFEQIKAGTKTIELRLNDEKRQQMMAGDTVIFTREPDNTEELRATIVERLVYPNFAALVRDFPSRDMGFDAPPTAGTARPSYYTAEQEAEYGALGLRVKIHG